jgi:hypothetical protein
LDYLTSSVSRRIVFGLGILVIGYTVWNTYTHRNDIPDEATVVARQH